MAQITRPDVDIAEDIRAVIAHYPPLQADRHHIAVTVQDGIASLIGHVRSVVSRKYLIDHTQTIRGVRSVNDTQLYCDEMIRLEAGRRMSSGLIANTTYGVVVVTGELTEGANVESVAASLTQIPGVTQVITKL